MHDGDRKRFSEIMARVGAVYSEDLSHRLRPYWELLAPRMDIDEFAAAVDRHMVDPERGRFFPRPADLVQAGGRDDRPGADEAWAIAIAARNEADTVCWTEEIAEASAAAWPILELGDKVGARMAFLQAYQRLVAKARERGERARWQLSLGHDREGRAVAAEQAVRDGRMPREAVAHLLLSEASGVVADAARLLTGKVVAHPARADGAYRQRMAELRAAIEQGEDERAAQGAEREAARAAFAKRKAEALAHMQACSLGKASA